MTSRTNDKQPITIKQIEDTVAQAVSDAQQLQRSTGSLPRVDQNGNSECPFAEQLYAKHEELRKKVQQRLAELHECLLAIDEQITGYGHDLAVVSSQKDRLNRDRPRAHFSEAEANLAGLYKRCLQVRDRIEQAILFLDEVLQQAATKRLPGRMPRDRQHWSGATVEPGSPNPVGDGKSGVDRELEALFEIDRRTKCDK
jgi:hypothetical protein